MELTLLQSMPAQTQLPIPTMVRMGKARLLLKTRDIVLCRKSVADWASRWMALSEI